MDGEGEDEENSLGERNIREHKDETCGPVVTDFNCCKLCGFLPRSSGISRAVIDFTLGRRDASGKFFVTPCVEEDSGVLKAFTRSNS